MADGQLNFDDADYEQKLRVWNYKRLLAEKYDVVVTNPPYMGGSGMNGKLAQFVKDNYPDSKSDLFAAFIERCASLTNNHGISAMITQHSWMFLSSYEKLRQKLRTHEILNMAHLGARAFAEIGGEVVQCTAFTLRSSHIANYNGLYVRLVDFDNADQKEIGFLSGNHRYIAQADNFIKIPGMPISYWASENLILAFENGTRMDKIVNPKQGLATADNDRFLRYWWEVDINNVKFDASSRDDALESGKKWFPYNKGGSYRRWYGNYDYVVNWENDGCEIRNFVDDKGKQRSRPQNTDYYFQEAITWPLITSGGSSVRFRTHGSIHDVSGMSAFTKEKKQARYIIGLLNTKIGDSVLKVLNPTLNSQVGDFQNIPVIVDKEQLERILLIVSNCILIAENDWNSDETSWDFDRLFRLADY